MNTRTRALRAPASRLVAACSAGGRLPRPPRAVARRNAAAAGRALAARGGPAGPGAARASSRPSARGVGTLAGRAAGAPRSTSGRRRVGCERDVTTNQISPTTCIPSGHAEGLASVTRLVGPCIQFVGFKTDGERPPSRPSAEPRQDILRSPTCGGETWHVRPSRDGGKTCPLSPASPSALTPGAHRPPCRPCAPPSRGGTQLVLA